MPTGWPPEEPPYDRTRWPKYLPPRAATFPVQIALDGMGHPIRMASIWSRRTLDLAHRYYAAARQCVWSNWAIERGEDWSPTGAEFTRDVEAMWISGCELLIAAHQAQIWARRIDPDIPEVLGLRAARNAIEHLDEATFDEDHVIATTSDDGKKAWISRNCPRATS